MDDKSDYSDGSCPDYIVYDNGCMQSRILILLVLAGLACFSSAHAAAVATVAALNSPLWLLQNDTRTRLGLNANLNIGDSISTGDTGRAEIQLRGKTFLRLDSNSEITFRAMHDSDAYPELYVHRGRACINYTAGSGDPAKFKVNLGDAMFAIIQLRGDVCVLRLQPMSAIRLYAGSVELTHAVGPDRIILSEAGTELHIRDDGSYEMLLPDDNNLSILEMAQPFIVEETFAETVDENTESESADTVDSAAGVEAETLVVTEPETSDQDAVSPYVYTVYLFSTRDEETARQVNQKFQKAGHETQIYAGNDDSGTRYRIAMTGFESRRTAQTFSDSIIGKLGVTGTWIGKDSR